MRIAALGPNGTLRKPVIVWIVRVGDDVYVRSVNGPNAAWFRGVQARHQGRLWTAGVDKDVDYIDVNCTQHQIDAAYQAKYARYPDIVPHIVTPRHAPPR